MNVTLWTITTIKKVSFQVNAMKCSTILHTKHIKRTRYMHVMQSK